MWLAPLAVDSFEAGDAPGTSLVAAYVAAALRTNPDPGSATPAALARARRTGWDNGTNTQRQQVLNCLVQIQPDGRVSALLDASIRANLDVRRYYGLPLHRVHNHGLMANLALIDSGGILARPGLFTRAESRLLRDVQVVRDRLCGMVYEQASGYQGVNAVLWKRAADRLAAAGRPRAVATLRAAAAQMAVAFDHLVTPGGALVAVGDTSPQLGLPVTGHRALRMLCRSAGWAAGRTAWTPAATHYTLRFGPARTMHGHNDHGSVTWWPKDDLLIDPGYYFDGNTAVGQYGRSNAAHNVLGVSGVELSGPTALLRASWRPGADTYTVRDRTSQVIRTRSVRIDRSLPLLMVLDRATATRPRIFAQRWHIAPGWRRTVSPGLVTKGSAVAGIVALDLTTGRTLARTTRTAWLFPTSRTITTGLVLATRKTARSVSIFTVVYRSTSRTRPVLRWLAGSTPGTGTVRVWWGRAFRDIRVDTIGIRAP